jgi:hypothetical protein
MKKKIVFAAIAAVVGAVALYVGVNSIDADPPDVSAFTTTSEIPADEDNAWCGFVAATNAVKRWVEPMDWKKLSPDEIDAVVAENAEAIAIFQNAARRAKWCDAAARYKGFFDNFFPITDFTIMIMLYKAKAERQIARGEIAAAVEGVGDLLMLSRTIQSDAEAILCWLVADGARGFALSLAAQLVASGKASDEELRALFGTLLLTDVSTLRKSVQQAINNEFVYVLGDAHRIVRLDVAKALPCEWKQILPTRFSYHPNSTTALYVQFAGKAKELLSSDYDKGAWDSFGSEIETAKPRLFCRLTPNYVGWLLLGAVLPAYNSLAERLARAECGLSAVKVVVAAELYRRKTGQRPESLAALVPEILPSMPTDPFDHGAALKYDVERGIVWTVGPDRDFTGDIQSGKKSYGRNRKYVVNLDGSEAK